MSWETQIVLNLISSGVLTQWPLAYTSFLAYETLLGPMIKLHPLQPSSVFNDTGKYNSFFARSRSALWRMIVDSKTMV